MNEPVPKSPPTKEEMTQYRIRAKSEPENLYLQRDYFWKLYHYGKHVIEIGELKSAVFCASQMMPRHNKNPKALTSLTWLLYFILRKIHETCKENTPLPEETHRVINWLSELPIAPNDDALGATLSIASRLSKTNPVAYLPLIQLTISKQWNERDWQRGKDDSGRSYPSTVEQILVVAAKALFENGSQKECQQFLPVLEMALQRVPDSIWLIHNLGKLQLKIGRNEEARTFIRKVLREKPNEFWAWQLLAETFSGSDPEKAIACFERALACPAKDPFLVGVHQAVGIEWAKLKQFPQAKYHISRAIEIREQNGWKPTRELTEMISESWYEKTQPAVDPELKKKVSQAEEILLEGANLRKIIGTVKELKNDVKGNLFTHVENCFIPPPLVKKGRLKIGDTIEVLAELRHDAKKNRDSWIAVQVQRT